MAKIDVKNIEGAKVSEIDLTDSIYNVEIKQHILHDVVKMQLAARRSGTADTKKRGEVAGSTRKLYKQKGTGNARSGSIKSPLKRGGGVVFGPHPRSYEYKVPKKVRKSALKMALSSKLQNNNLTIIDQFNLSEIKTKSFIKFLNAFSFKSVLLVINEENQNLTLSARNVKDSKIIPVEGLNVYDILKYNDLVLIQPSIESIEKRLN